MEKILSMNLPQVQDLVRESNQELRRLEDDEGLREELCQSKAHYFHVETSKKYFI